MGVLIGSKACSGVGEGGEGWDEGWDELCGDYCDGDGNDDERW